MNKKIYKQAMKKTGDELQEWLQFKHRGSSVQAKKGKVPIPANKSIKTGSVEYVSFLSKTACLERP